MKTAPPMLDISRRFIFQLHLTRKEKSMKTVNRFDRCSILCLVAALAATCASARTVYDAGKAMRENMDSSSPTSVLFTDSKGGKWSYYFSNELGTPNSEVTLKRNGPKAYGS